MKAQNSAVISLSMSSSLFISNNVTFRNNIALTSLDPSTLRLKNANQVMISGAFFENNPQHNIWFTKCFVEITDSIFTNATKSHIFGRHARLKVSNV